MIRVSRAAALIAGVSLPLLPLGAAAAQLPVNVGVSANDGSGDSLRTAFAKLNANDADLYASLAAEITARLAAEIANGNAAAAALTAAQAAQATANTAAASLATAQAAQTAANAAQSTASGAATASALAAEVAARQAAISGLAPSATTDTTNAGNIGSGLLPAARIGGVAASAMLLTPTGANTAQALADWSNIRYDARAFGLICDGTSTTGRMTSNTTAVSAALTAAASTGGVVEIPGGLCYFNGPLSWTANNIGLKGQGMGATSLFFSDATDDLITIGSTSTNVNDARVGEFSISATAAKTAGAGVRVLNGHNVTADHIRMNANMFTGFDLDGGAQQFNYKLSHFEINSGRIGIRLGANTFAQDVFIDTGEIYGTTAYGIYMLWASGVAMRDIDIGGCAVGVGTFPASGHFVGNVWMYNIEPDTCTDSGYQFWTNGGLVSQVKMIAPWASNTGSSTHVAGIDLDGLTGTVDGVSIISPIISHNYGHGIRLGNARHVSITDPNIWNNGVATNNTYDGIDVEAGSNNNDWSVTGGSIGGGGVYAGSSNQQKYGIEIKAGATDRFLVQGVNTFGNLTGAIFDGSTGTNAIVRDNPGFDPAGSATVGVGSSPWTFANGHTPSTLHISGGTVSAIVQNGLTLYTTTNVPIDLGPNESVTITYSAAPTVRLVKH